MWHSDIHSCLSTTTFLFCQQPSSASCHYHSIGAPAHRLVISQWRGRHTNSTHPSKHVTTFTRLGSSSRSLLHSTTSHAYILHSVDMINLSHSFTLRSGARSRSITRRCHDIEAGRMSYEISFHDGRTDGRAGGWMDEGRRFLLFMREAGCLE